MLERALSRLIALSMNLLRMEFSLSPLLLRRNGAKAVAARFNMLRNRKRTTDHDLDDAGQAERTKSGPFEPQFRQFQNVSESGSEYADNITVACAGKVRAGPQASPLPNRTVDTSHTMKSQPREKFLASTLCGGQLWPHASDERDSE